MKFESVKKGVNLKSKEDRKNVKLEKQQHFGSCNIFDNSKQTSKNKVEQTNVFLWLIPTADVENIHDMYINMLMLYKLKQLDTYGDGKVDEGSG